MRQEVHNHGVHSKKRSINWIRQNHIGATTLPRFAAFKVCRRVLEPEAGRDSIYSYDDIIKLASRHAGAQSHAVLQVALFTPEDARRFANTAADRTEPAAKLEVASRSLPKNISGYLSTAVRRGPNKDEAGLRHVGYTFNLSTRSAIDEERRHFLAATGIKYRPSPAFIPLAYTEDQAVAEAMEEELRLLNPSIIPVELGPVEITPIHEGDAQLA